MRLVERKPWTREELILAINLYCKTPFGRIHIRNPEIIDLAHKLGRTPGSVSYKLANFASIDPSIDRKGAANVSRLDRKVWHEFLENWDEMSFESEMMMAKLKKAKPTETEVVNDYSLKTGDTRQSLVKIRVNQQFFRKMVMASYDETCCITGINNPELLVASHIVPWAIDQKNRLNPMNGLCLNALHDRAFDKGLITIDGDFKVMVSRKVRHKLISQFDQQPIKLPRRFIPAQEFLEFHRQSVFQRD